MAWCLQAASHCLNQCCPRSLSPYGVTRPQRVNHLTAGSKAIAIKYHGLTSILLHIWLYLSFISPWTKIATSLKSIVLKENYGHLDLFLWIRMDLVKILLGLESHALTFGAILSIKSTTFLEGYVLSYLVIYMVRIFVNNIDIQICIYQTSFSISTYWISIVIILL